IRAVSDNRDLAESSGIDVQRVVLTVWVAGSALAGFGGLVLAVTQSVQWDMGWSLLLTIFAGVILGGLGSVYGPIIGGLVVGMAAEVSTLWFSAEFKTAFALGALILVLLVRPQGILGVRQRIG
ncbi:MAG: branched-chain amino acid ABC transporter permease, partial [Acidimicrobiia bacterium]|nr:branched-chain amino acid ABC transporter permease [Acidimicrobiia bacterium]